MSITFQTPKTIHLGGPVTSVNDRAASASITPGMLVELDNNAGVIRYKPHASAGGDGVRAVAVDASMLNKGVDDAYAANDLVEVAVGAPGATFWMLIPSGQNITAGDQLESAGDGKLVILASGVALFAALENVNNSAGPSDARIRVEVV